MRVLLCLAILIGLASTQACVSQYQLMEDKCIRPLHYNTGDAVIADELPYYRNACSQDQAHLPIIKSDEENDIFNRIATSFDQLKDQKIRMLMDLNCNKTTRRMEWVDGTSVSYSPGNTINYDTPCKYPHEQSEYTIVSYPKNDSWFPISAFTFYHGFTVFCAYDAPVSTTQKASTFAPITTNIVSRTTIPSSKTTTTVQPTVGQDNYCKCGIVEGWFDNWEPADIWVDVIIILDTSKSMGASLEEAKSVITSFVGLMSTDTNAEFYSRIGVIAVSDTVEVVYNLNMSNTDDLDNIQQHQIDKIDVGAAFQAALKMFADGSKTSSFREKAKQIIYYLTNSAPGANMNGVDDFKTGGGIIIVNDFILEGEVADPGLQKLASDNFFFTDLSENYINSLGVFCEANCFCTPDVHPYNDDENSPRTQANLGCYHPVNNGIPQQKARQTCQKEAGSLVSIHDKNKEFFVNGVVSVFGPKKKFWIGFENDGTQWNWDDNSTDLFTDWDVANGQPNTNGGKLLCAYAQQGTGFNTPWTAANCAMGGVIYVCESRPCSIGYKNCA